MRNRLLTLFIGAVTFAAITTGPVLKTYAVAPFLKEFQAKYVKKDSKEAKAKSLAGAVANADTGKCFVCHVKGEKKTVRNAYGVQLSKLLDKDKFKAKRVKAEAEQVKKEINEALDKVAKMFSIEGNDKSPTFGQLIAAGKLPGAAPVKEEATTEATTEERPAEAKPAATVAKPATGGDLLAQLVAQLKAEIRAEVVAELLPQLRAEITAELEPKLRREIKASLKASLKAVVMTELIAEMHPVSEADEKVAIEEIEKIGGTISEVAQNDDSKIVDFHLGGKELGDEQLAHVKSVRKLVQLHLKDTKITDAGMQHLAGIPSLTRLHLEKTTIGDAGLAHLRGLDNLHYLNLYGTTVSDAGLEHLRGMTNLRKLYLWQSQVTADGVKSLQSALPDCEIVWSLTVE